MSKMSYIHYLCEKEDKKALIEELGSTEMANGFLEAHKEIRLKKETDAFSKLNNILDSSIDVHIQNKIKDNK